MINYKTSAIDLNVPAKVLPCAVFDDLIEELKEIR